MKQIKGLSVELAYKDDPTTIKCIGTAQVLEQVKKTLTITNRSVGFRIKTVKNSISNWSKRLKSTLNQESAAKIEEQLKKWKSELEKLNDELHQEYFTEHENSLFIPSGFWFLAEKILDNHHLNTEIKSHNVQGQRPYQKELVAELLKYKRATGVLGTGLGKSRCAISIALSAKLVKKRTIIIVPTQDLVDQFVRSVKEFHSSVTGAYTGKFPKKGTDILVTTIGTARKYIDIFDVIIIDECHHSPASTWNELLASCKNAQHVYAFTATPFRSDGLDLAIYAFSGPVVYERDIVWGIQNGFLEHFDVWQITITAKKGKETIVIPSTRNGMSAYKQLCNNPNFINETTKIIQKSLDSNRKIIAMFKTLSPAQSVSKKLKQFEVADADYKKPLRDFQNKEKNLLLATTKLVGEGIDIPEADTLFLITQNSADAITYQALGRLLRKGNKKPIVIDIVVHGYGPFKTSANNRMRIWKKAADSVTEITI